MTAHLNDLLTRLKNFYDARNTALKASDLAREQDPKWYKRNDLTGMMMYVNSFANTLKGLESKLDYCLLYTSSVVAVFPVPIAQIGS